MCFFVILALHSQYDANNYNSDDKERNDDAQGFSGFALQMQKQKHVDKCSEASS